MPKLAKVALKDKRTGAITKINAFDYQRDIARYSATHKIVGMSRGDATDDVVEKAVAESNENLRRLNDPKEAHKRGDRQRLQDQHRINVPVETEEPAAEPDIKTGNMQAGLSSEPAAEAPKSPEPGDPDFDWQAARWFAKRKHVEMVTGVKPQNSAHADELMAAHSGE